MKHNTARRLRRIPPGYLLVGIDPHKKKHAVTIMTTQVMILSKFKVSNSLDGFAYTWLQGSASMRKAKWVQYKQRCSLCQNCVVLPRGP